MGVPTTTYQKVKVASIAELGLRNLSMTRRRFRQPAIAGREHARGAEALDLFLLLAGALSSSLGMKTIFMTGMKRSIIIVMTKLMTSSSMT